MAWMAPQPLTQQYCQLSEDIVQAIASQLLPVRLVVLAHRDRIHTTRLRPRPDPPHLLSELTTYHS